MRRQPTRAEDELWEALRAGKVGAKFRRQHPLDRFVLDFYCPAHRLCVEVDGPVHERQQERDAERNAYLAARGIRTMRLSNEQVLHRREDALARIAAVLRES